MKIKPVAVKKELSKHISIDDFPPVLRKPTEKRLEIALSTNEWINDKQACLITGVDYQSFRSMKMRYKKKAMDLDSYVANATMLMLPKFKPQVYMEVIRGAKDRFNSQAPSQQKLYAQLVGDIQTGRGGDRLQINNVINLGTAVPIVSANGNIVPNDLKDAYDEDD